MVAAIAALAALPAIAYALLVESYPYEVPHPRSLLHAELFVAIGGLLPIAGMLYAALSTYKPRLFWWCASVAALTYAVWGDLCSRALN
jgi:hypothetical protein